MIQASAPGKIILLGEHAVVYGQPAIAIPVSTLRATAQAFVSTPGDGLNIEASDLGTTSHIRLESRENEDPLSAVALLVLEKLKLPLPDLNIQVHSDIPLASGLGSGAAISAAVVRVLSSALEHKLEDEELNQIVYQVEKIYHGMPSGVDNTVIVYERPVYFIRGNPLEFLPVQGSFQFLIANTGISSSTRLVVEDVNRLYKTDPDYYGRIFDSIGELVTKGLLALQNDDAVVLGTLMSKNHHYLQQLTVSSHELDGLVEAALDAGALGAKLSGGGRGGNMIALVSQDSLVAVKEALLRAGAARVFDTILS
ncbi:MAG: mevalonate kinase [Chloroflexota bacterium]